MSSNAAPGPQWPPRSPHEALLSTPGGRERLRRMAERASPSPSPTKSRLSRAAGALAARSTNLNPGAASEDEGLDDDDDDDDDEETLQLKLQEIQARLKLKKLQNAKAHKKTAGGPDGEHGAAARPSSAPLSRPASGLRSPSRIARPARPARPAQRSRAQTEVQVPASPVRKAQPPPAQTSPSRVLLGIDKGLKARDVSLRRAPSLRRAQDEANPAQAAGGYLRRTKTPVPQAAGDQPPPPPMSFNERLASVRSEEAARHERQERIERLRSRAFNVGREEMERYKSEAVDLPDRPAEAPAYSREEVLSSVGRARGGGYLQRSNTAPSLRSRPPGGRSPEPPEGQAEVPEAEASSFEPYSGLHLSRRILPHQVLARAVTGKKTYVLKDLLRHVKAPDFALPDVESDVVVFAIVASKSDPRSHKPTHDRSGQPQPSDRGKYMVLTLVDLAWEVELFLFNSGFDRFWKLSTGTVVAILNPAIMPPPPNRADTGRFSLVINSDEDAVLEVGTARDLGYCRSVKADGKLCSAWVNARRTEHCEFHTNEAVRRVRGRRTEVNMMDFGGGGGGGAGKAGGPGADHGRHRYARDPDERKKTLDRARARYDHYDASTHSRVFVSSMSPAALIDREGGLADRRERTEGLKKRIAAKERETDLMRQLAQVGAGAGREYMRLGGAAAAAAARLAPSATTPDLSAGGAASSGASTPAADDAPPKKADARSLGLLAPKGREQIHLSPVKRKRVDSSRSSSSVGGGGRSGALGRGGGGGGGGDTGGSGGFGWGSTLRDKLARMKDGEKLNPALASASAPAAAAASSAPGGAAGAGPEQGNRSPVRKKTRFVTAKGIREAGRESLGTELAPAAGEAGAAGPGRMATLDDDDDGDDDDDDDDELVIVR